MTWTCVCGTPLDFVDRRCRHCRRSSIYVPQEDTTRTMTTDDKLCGNYFNGCNWLAAAGQPQCFSCSLTRIIPPQDVAVNRTAYKHFERAKRHLIASLLRLRLLPRYITSPQGYQLEINLLQDWSDNYQQAGSMVYTGHLNGVISINANEADPIRSEKTRLQFKEKYRTLLGSLRHESGHYFWLALVSPNMERLDKFRALFGDDRIDYQTALDTYYNSPPPSESPNYITTYAQMHPYEDWAETWAHYLHMESVVVVAARAGMTFPTGEEDSFDSLVPRWRRTMNIANALSTTLGHRPNYPFHIGDGVLNKMRFIHDILLEERRSAPVAPLFAAQSD